MLVLRRLTLVALLLMLALGACRPGSSSDGPTGRQEPAQEVALQAAGGRRLGGSVTLLGAWEGVELDAFLDMVAPFQKATGVSVFFRSSRDVSGVISRSLNSGDPPDLAGLPGPGLMTDLVRSGRLVDLSTVLDMEQLRAQYDEEWLRLGIVDGQLGGIFVRASVKGLIWRAPAGVSTGCRRFADHDQ